MNKYDEEYFKKTHKIVGVLLPKKRPLWIRWTKIIRKYSPFGRLLDIGCGEGYFLHYAERYYETYGTDISEYCVKETTERTRKSKISVGNILELNYKNKYFDVITCFDVMEHVKNYEEAICECKRVLNDGGIFVVRVPNPSSLGLKWKKQEWFAHKDETHVNLLSRRKWIESFEKHGFEIKEIVYDGLWDTPYFKHIPKLIQTVFIKIPFITLFFMGTRIPEKYGENMCIIAQNLKTQDK